jgi:hypothetical protein
MSDFFHYLHVFAAGILAAKVSVLALKLMLLGTVAAFAALAKGRAGVRRDRSHPEG